MLENRLSSLSRIGWLLANLGFGLLPSLLFFAWVERNASLPWLPIELGWPWFVMTEESPWLRATWNFGLVLAFGGIHSVLAQPAAHRVLERLIPLQAVRSFYLAATGISLLLLMGFWQHTGLILWIVPMGFLPLQITSVVLFWALLLLAGKQVARHDPLEFVGIRQLYRSASELKAPRPATQLITSGIYSQVRHPIYSFTLLAVLLTPFMTLDRMALLVAMVTYLVPAIRLEERKLIGIFGDRYLEYRKRVPAIFPRFAKSGCHS